MKISKLLPALTIQNRPALLLLALLMLSSASPTIAGAQTLWKANPASGEWTNTANWIGAPSGALLEFSNSTITTLTNSFSADTLFGGVLFDAGAPAYTLTGNSVTFPYTNGTSYPAGIIDNSTSSILISVPITLNNDLPVVVSNAASTLTISGPMNDGGLGAGVSLSGSGTLAITGNNSYIGYTTVEGGSGNTLSVSGGIWYLE
jgi:autotransporter-associated beta strand protein